MRRDATLLTLMPQPEDSDEASDEDTNPYAWIGKWVQKPKGERCRTSREGREGFTTTILLQRAAISKEQYSMYKVRLRFTFGRTTDSPQKTAHQLIGRYFDTTKSYKVNRENRPDSWALIVEKVRPISILFDVSDLPADERTPPTLPMACEELGPRAHRHRAPRCSETRAQEV